MTVNDLIKLLDTKENKYGGATGKPRELYISINDKFCGSIESAELEGHGDGLVTDVTLEIKVPEMKGYYDKKIRDKAIEEFAEKMKEVTYQWFASGKIALGMIDEIAEQMKEVEGMSEELKPCPFCGKEIDINKDMYLPERD